MPAAVEEPEREDQNDRRAGRAAVEEQHLDILLEIVTAARFEQGSVGDRGQGQRRGSNRDVAPIDGPDPTREGLDLTQPEPPLRATECPRFDLLESVAVRSDRAANGLRWLWLVSETPHARLRSSGRSRISQIFEAEKQIVIVDVRV